MFLPLSAIYKMLYGLTSAEEERLAQYFCKCLSSKSSSCVRDDYFTSVVCANVSTSLRSLPYTSLQNDHRQ